jgi:RNA polymerase sigma factor (sigma-70 family)
MVLGVCRRVLRDAADADDAFQATFLVLVRKAGSLRAPDRLAGWLYQVAYRTARKARALRLARARREGELFDVPAGEPPAEVVWRELRPIFDAELDRLPDRLRQPAVLCLLEGRSKADAARTLGWPEGTLSCRLQRARERLRARLAARGLTLSTGALAAALFEGAGAAAVPDWLIESTLRGAWAPAAAAGVRALADGVTQGMFMTKVKSVAAAVLVAGVVGTGTGVALVPGAGPGQVVADEPARGEPTKAAAPAPRALPQDDPRALTDAIQEARLRVVTADLQAKNGVQRTEVALRELQRLIQQRLDTLRSQAERLRPLVDKGTLTRDDWDRLQVDIKTAEAELKAFASSAPAPAPADPERAIQRQELELLKERLDWEEKMVKKGFMSEAQVKKTRLEVARAEAAVAKAEAPKPPDPRRRQFDEAVKKLEEIVRQTREGVDRRIIPSSDLLNAQLALEMFKLKQFEAPAAPTQVTAEQRAAMEAVVKKLEEIVAQTAEAVRKKIQPEQELLNAEIKLLEYKFKLAELSGPPAVPPPAPGSPAGKAETGVAAAERDLARAEALYKQKVISAAEVRPLRVDLNRLRAHAATARGDHAEAAKQLDAAVAEIEDRAADVRAGVERQTNPRSELRMVEVGLAEARVEALRAHVRCQLAEIVTVREAELKELRALADAKAISAEELRQAERAVADAKARLAAER